jgi:DNA (cytosine-5)-methyltransferase 1
VKVVFAADISNDARGVYSANFDIALCRMLSAPIETIFDGVNGTRNTNAETRLRRRVGRTDLLLAGPPCQGHSDLNNHSRRNDARNLLYLRAIRAVETLKPTVALIENVPPVVHDEHNVVESARHILDDLGYHITTFTTSALCVCVFGSE